MPSQRAWSRVGDAFAHEAQLPLRHDSVHWRALISAWYDETDEAAVALLVGSTWTTTTSARARVGSRGGEIRCQPCGTARQHWVSQATAWRPATAGSQNMRPARVDMCTEAAQRRRLLN